jgi:Arm DNA-binding domain
MLPKLARDRKTANGKQEIKFCFPRASQNQHVTRDGRRMKLTTDTVTALKRPPGKAEHFEWDTELPGFGVRMRGETKRWVIQYRVGGQQRRESLGDTRKVRLDDARKIARQRFAQAELGTRPSCRAPTRQRASPCLQADPGSGCCPLRQPERSQTERWHAAARHLSAGEAAPHRSALATTGVPTDWRP